MILGCASKSFKAIPHLFICMRQLRIIEYVQSQRTPKYVIWGALRQYLTSNGLIEKYPAALVDRFKGELRPKTLPSVYVIILMTLWKKGLVQSFAVFWPFLMKLWSYKVLNPAWVISYPRTYKTFHSWFFPYLCSFYEKRAFYTVHSFLAVLTIPHEFMKL